MYLFLCFWTSCSEPYIVHPMTTEPDPVRRVTYVYSPLCRLSYSHVSGSANIDRAHGYQTTNDSILAMIPETLYPRYEHYPPHHSRTTGFRALNQEPVPQWNAPECVSDFLLTIVHPPDVIQVFRSGEESGNTQPK